VLPRVRLRRHVGHAGRRLVFGTVSCARCRVTLVVLGNLWLQRRISVRRHAALALRGPGLQPGRLEVLVEFAQHRVAGRHERLTAR